MAKRRKVRSVMNHFFFLFEFMLLRECRKKWEWEWEWGLGNYAQRDDMLHTNSVSERESKSAIALK